MAEDCWRMRLISGVNTSSLMAGMTVALAATACVRAMTGVNLVKEFVEYSNKDEAFKILKDNKGLKNMAIKVAKKYGLEEVTPGYEQAGRYCVT